MAQNSFTETVNQLVKTANIALSFAQKTNESLTTQSDTVTMSIDIVDPITGDASVATYSIPSYNTTINKANIANRTIDTFINGTGKILQNDGTYREIKVNPVAVSPSTITNVTPPTKFGTKNNWFFESLMFPQLTISFDLKGKIDDRSDRVAVRRVIFDNFNDVETQWFLDNVIDESLSYYEAISLLNENNKKYWQDDDIQNLPLYTEPYTGYFLITNKRTISGKEWFYLDTLSYGIPSDEPVVKNLELAVGNQLRYNNSIYQIDEIEISEKRIHLIAMVGIEYPSIAGQFEIFNAPFSTKISEIPIGWNECNMIFLKGINEDYNLLGDEWSNAISFFTNNLILTNSTTTLNEYYSDNILDFGKELEGQAKEKFIPAWFGVKPDAPVLEVAGLSVNQINTQLNASLDVDEVKKTQSQIESTKTIINSLKSTIAQQKSELVNTTDVAQRENLNAKISININDFSKRTIEYQSLVKSLSTIAYESDAVNAQPKYRARGFFNIPNSKREFLYDKLQEIIQFEIAYRYLKLDSTGVDLNTYVHNDPSTGKKKRGVFSDWNLVYTSIKERNYDSSLGIYKWVDPNISDGEEVNINQIDIPIQKGEKVEIKIRSISEAGWPNNPIKSDWSESIIKEFPSNLQGSDQVTNILTDAITEETTVKLNETLAASGIDTHIADSIPNPNVGTGTYFKHGSINLAYDRSTKDVNGLVTATATVDLQNQLNNLSSNTFLTLTNPPDSSSNYPQLTGTLQQFFQAIINIDASIFDEFENILT